jgi:hypothetical protein
LMEDSVQVINIDITYVQGQLFVWCSHFKEKY